METDPAKRKALPITSGVLDYFPDALLEVAHCSKVGNDQHNPGEPLHWAKEKSTDEADALGRHLLERGTIDTDGVRHSAKVAWRALAMLQREIDAERAAAASSDTPLADRLAALKTKADSSPVGPPAIRTSCGVSGCKIHALFHNRLGEPSGHPVEGS